MRPDTRRRIAVIERGEVPDGYKKYEKGIFPSNWMLKKMKDVAIRITDGTHDTPVTVNEGVPYITAIHVKEGKIDFDNCYYLKEEDHEVIYKRCNPENGDLLLVNIGAGTATPALIQVNFEFSLKNVALIKPDRKKIDPKFLEIFQSSVKSSLFHKLASGGAQPFLSLGEIKRLDIVVPPLHEQIYISSIIAKWDRAIELKEKLLEQKKLQKKGLLERLLTGKVRLPRFREEWKKTNLSNVFERVTRRNDGGSSNVLTISAQKGLVSQTDYFNKSVASETLDKYFLLRKGEFAYNKSYSNGYPMGAIKRLNDYSEGVVTTLYLCFKLKDDAYDSDFFEQYFEAGLLNKALMKITQEGARAHGLLNLSVSDFFAITLCIPQKLEQEAIGEILTQSDNVIRHLEQELNLLKTQKKGLMQLLLTGKVRVPC